MDYDISELTDQIMETIKRAHEDLKKLNVMILGKTGVGKSTLINNMFHQNLAETGIGKPITQKIRKIEKPGFPLAVYDTPGLELEGKNSIDVLMNEVTGEINKGIHSGDISKAIHCIWYCVSTPSHRFEQAEIDFIKQFQSKTSEYDVPIIVVLTQSYAKNDAKNLKMEIEKENLPIVKIIPVLAGNYKLNDEYTVKAYGLDTLAEIMYSVIPEAVQKTFVAVQKVNLELKKRKAQAIIASASATALTVGATPIPFSDAFLLIPSQVSMIAGITAVFGLPIEKSTITAILSSMIGVTGTTAIGKTIVSNLLKFIPGVGSVVGGVISGGTATALTTALGEAYLAIMVLIHNGEMTIKDLSTEHGEKEITRIFVDKLKLKRDKNGKPEANNKD